MYETVDSYNSGSETSDSENSASESNDSDNNAYEMDDLENRAYDTADSNNSMFETTEEKTLNEFQVSGQARRAYTLDVDDFAPYSFADGHINCKIISSHVNDLKIPSELTKEQISKQKTS